MGATPEAASALDPWIGRVLDGRYRITGLIGAGGMGSVYKVEHIAMGKVMALKVLSARLGASQDSAERFEREAKVGGRIGHPNCVAVSDFGTTDDGSFYLVMELLQGETLGELLTREQRLPWRRALSIARHVLRGLGHAHEHGVVHRDIKPDNIFLARHDDDPEFAKILDFGIAKLVGEGGTTITQAGITVGTPAYLSPEQAFGGELDGRSDLYSLSVLLYEMLTGHTPFADRDLVAMLTAHAVAEVPAMGEDVPPPVEELVRAGLAKTPADRIQTAADYVARIDVLLQRAPSIHSGVHPVASPMTPPPGQIASIAPPRDVRKLAMWIGAGVLGVGILAAIASAVGGGSSSPAPAKAKPTPTVKTEAKPTPKPAAVPVDAGPPPVPIAPPSERYDAAIKQLTKGKTCPLRKAAVAELAAIGDPRAIPVLKKARYRMRGGILGIGDSNTNQCLKADAEAAIKKLGG